MSSVKAKDGSIKHERQEIADAFADFYAELYSSQSCDRDSTIERKEVCAVEPFTLMEVQGEIKCLRKGKTKDSSGVLAEIIKVGGGRLAQALKKSSMR